MIDKKVLTKTKAYRAGCYLMPVPPVTTLAWSEQDWINFVDNSGKWTCEIQEELPFH